MDMLDLHCLFLGYLDIQYIFHDKAIIVLLHPWLPQVAEMDAVMNCMQKCMQLIDPLCHAPGDGSHVFKN